MGKEILFAILAGVAFACGIGVVAAKHPLRSALSLVGVMINLALMYLMLNASFVSAVQVMVYAGAIMILFIFVIMLLNLDVPKHEPKHRFNTGVALFSGFALLEIVTVFLFSALKTPSSLRLLPAANTGALEIGRALFEPQWLIPFEAVSILLLVATIGVVVLAVRRLS
jgi:NADH-quinone oxidoreductase subunit J